MVESGVGGRENGVIIVVRLQAIHNGARGPFQLRQADEVQPAAVGQRPLHVLVAAVQRHQVHPRAGQGRWVHHTHTQSTLQFYKKHATTIIIEKYHLKY